VIRDDRRLGNLSTPHSVQKLQTALHAKAKLNPATASMPCTGPFPPPALPGFRGTANLSATPPRPACPSRASGCVSLSILSRNFTPLTA
jgi:hypothetical protein